MDSLSNLGFNQKIGLFKKKTCYRITQMSQNKLYFDPMLYIFVFVLSVKSLAIYSLEEKSHDLIVHLPRKKQQQFKI